MDNITKDKRSRTMSKIKSKNTKPELLVRKFLHDHGIRYRLHLASLPGKPDIVITKLRVVIFINGCFWHGHKAKTCKLARIPKSNIEFWTNKIKRNKKRDERTQKALRQAGWHVFNVWECSLKKNGLDILWKKLSKLLPTANSV